MSTYNRSSVSTNEIRNPPTTPPKNPLSCRSDFLRVNLRTLCLSFFMLESGFMAIVLSIIATLIAIASLVLTYLNFQRSKRLDVAQRLDHLLVNLSDLTSKNSEAHMLAARYAVLKVDTASIMATDEEHKR